MPACANAFGRAALVDPEVVRRRLRQIDHRLTLLADIRAQGQDAFIASIALQAQAERHLQLALQSMIDIALHWLADGAAPPPEDYGSAFSLLARQGVLDDELARRLRLAAGLRNVLVHGYLEIDPQQIWAHLQQLDDLEVFARAVEASLSS